MPITFESGDNGRYFTTMPVSIRLKRRGHDFDTQGTFMTFALRLAAAALAAMTFWMVPAAAQQIPQYQSPPPPSYQSPQPQYQPAPPNQAQPQPQPQPQYQQPPQQPQQPQYQAQQPQYQPQPQPQQPAPAPQHQQAGPSTYAPDELLGAGHRFFGNVSRGLASVIERAVSQWGLPNGYILGEEGSGAFVAGLRYGEGTLYTKNAGDLRVYWQGPSVGFDWGGDGARTMTLVYNLPATNAIYQRFAGIDGSAYVIGGFGMTALTASNIVLVPIRSGLGLRLGANIGYLKYTQRATWNPF
jgi:hypothetical protein